MTKPPACPGCIKVVVDLAFELATPTAISEFCESESQDRACPRCEVVWTLTMAKP